jgi:hypothetical protein
MAAILNSRHARPRLVPSGRARASIVDWWGGDILALVILVVLFILAIVLTRRG